MIALRLTESVDKQFVRPAFNLQEALLGHRPPNTILTSYVGEAAPGVFGPIQTWTAKFLFIEGMYYFFAEDELEDLAVGSYVEIRLKDDRLVVDTASYPMAIFNLGDFLVVATANLDIALDRLPGKRTFPGGVTSYTIDRSGSNNGTRILVYDIPDGSAILAPHLHTHGEAFYVVTGEVRDEYGSYKTGRLVVVGPNTFHRPTTVGRTVIVVMWTGGITSPPE